MKIKVKNSELNAESIQSLNALIELEINGSAAFKLSRIVKHLSSIVEDKVLAEKKIFEKWVERDSLGNLKVAKNENDEIIQGAFKLTSPLEFSKEMNSLMEIENEIPFDKIPLESLGLDKIRIKDLLRIDFLFE